MGIKKEIKQDLIFEPEALNFGTFHPQTPLTKLPRILLKIHNKGEETISGRLIAQVSWLIIPNIHFTCEPGQTCEHEIRMSTGAPHLWKEIEYEFDNLMLIDSNQGSFPVPGKYDTGIKKHKKLPDKPKTKKTSTKKTSRKIVVNPMLVLIPFFAVIGLVLLFFKPFSLSSASGPSIKNSTQADPDTNAILTLGAQTVYARVSQTHLAAQPSETAVPPQPSQTLAVFQTATPLPETQTYTPWPREEYSNPELLVYEYFEHINNGEYDLAWNMLTKRFQKECCSISGNDDFTIYENWWSHNVDRIEVNSAYLQEWDANPARVLVQMKYYYSDGQEEVMIFMYYFIIDESGQKLLIDEVL